MIRKFISEQFGEVRTFEEDGEIWFFGADVAKALGYTNYSDAIKDHTAENDRKALKYKENRDSRFSELWGSNGFKDKLFVNESGLYCMIFGSKLDSASDFKHWVTKVVLPSIRKNGGYINGQEDLPDAQLQKLKEHIQKLSEDISRYKNWWHKSNAARDKFKKKASKYRKETKELKSIANMYETYYFDLVNDFERLQNRAIQKALATPVCQEPIQATVTVDKYGFVVA